MKEIEHLLGVLLGIGGMNAHENNEAATDLADDSVVYFD